MKKKIFFSGLIVLLLCSAIVFADDAGYNGVFLRIPVDARATGMGGANLAVPSDGFSQLHNPAGIESITANNFTSSYRAMDLGRKLGFLSIGFPARGESALGFSWLYAGYGEVERRDNSGFLTGSTISSEEHVFGISFAKRFVPFLALGTKINYLHKNLGDLKANSVGINIGGMLFIDSLLGYRHGEDRLISDLTAGLVINNMAAKYNWESTGAGLAATKTDDFPLEFGLGVSARTLQRKLLVAADMDILIKSMDKPVINEDETQSITNESSTEAVFHFGGQYSVNDKLMIRTGLDDGTITAGAGFNFAFEKTFLAINYAFSGNRAGEGDDHIFSFEITF